jgi:hypothetical protein
MTHYDINYNRLALALVPLKLRRSLLMNFLYVLLSPVRRVTSLFDSYRDLSDYRLKHNGQVCYLRAVLNDRFDCFERRITIEDVDPVESPTLHLRSRATFLMADLRTSGQAVILNKRAFSVGNSVDFNVVVPVSLRGLFPEEQMHALIKTYKLASKRYTITYR